MVTKELLQKLFDWKAEQKKINADLYNLILQAADDNTLRTKVNKAHDRITKLEEKVEQDDDGMMVFVAGMLFTVLVVGIALMATGVV